MTSAADPFLLYHTVQPGVLELNGRASPGSIRDQFIRGVLAVDGLISADLLQSGESLLIVGAGVAGVSAALRASAREVSVSLVDQAQAPLSLLSANKRRVVSPTIFDWPSKHWQDTSFEGIFRYQEGTPDKVCSNLLAAVGQELAPQPLSSALLPKSEVATYGALLDLGAAMALRLRGRRRWRDPCRAQGPNF